MIYSSPFHLKTNGFYFIEIYLCFFSNKSPVPKEHLWQSDHNAQAGFDPSAAYVLAPALMLGLQATKVAGLISKSIKNPWARMRTLTLNNKKTNLEAAYRRFGIVDKYSTGVGTALSATGGIMVTTVTGAIAITCSAE